MADDRMRTIAEGVRDRQPGNRRRPTAYGLNTTANVGDKIAWIGCPDLIVPVREPHRQVVVDLAVLNRMRIAGLQNELMGEVRGIDELKELNPEKVFDIDRLLSKYCKAIQDWELMEKYSAHADGKHENDPFIITTNSYLQREILDKACLLNSTRPYDFKDGENPQLPIGSRPGLRMARDAQAFVKRFSFALFGGLSLLAPMVLMVLHKDTLTTLLTVSVSVLLFSFVVALWADDVSPSTVVATVAAYTAVLVVFVGTSS